MSPSEALAQRPRVLISVEDLERRITELAAEIDRDYAGGDPILCIGVLKGSVFFMVDLLKQVQTPLEIGFFQTSSYGGGTTAGEIRIRKDVDISVRDRDVLLIEDIVDTGYTLRTIMALLEFRGARSVKLCALLDKSAARQMEVVIEEEVPVFASGLGTPAPFADALKAQGTAILALVGNVRAARQVAEGGADYVVAQGTEAGGHTGRIGTLALLPQVMEAVAPTPVIAAGGVAGGRAQRSGSKACVSWWWKTIWKAPRSSRRDCGRAAMSWITLRPGRTACIWRRRNRTI